MGWGIRSFVSKIWVTINFSFIVFRVSIDCQFVSITLIILVVYFTAGRKKFRVGNFWHDSRTRQEHEMKI